MGYYLAVPFSTYLHIICVALSLNNNPSGIFQLGLTIQDSSSDESAKLAASKQISSIADKENHGFGKYFH